MATALTLFQAVLRKLTTAEIDQNFINLRTTADGLAALNPTNLPVSQTGAANSIVATDASGNAVATGKLTANKEVMSSASGATNPALIAKNGSMSLEIVYDATNDYATIQSIHYGVNVTDLKLQPSGGNVIIGGLLLPGTDNTQSNGSASKRWSVVYAGTGTINTSDAREKTAVRPLTTAEIAAAQDLSKEIGAYQFLSAVSAKGAAARYHIGMTVQRAVEIMVSHNLDPFAYGFICYDQWDDEFLDIPAVEAQIAQPAEYESRIVREPAIVDGVETIIERKELVCIKEAIEATEAQPARRQQVQVAGDRYSFRPDELLLFIARGFEARLAALEG